MFCKRLVINVLWRMAEGVVYAPLLPYFDNGRKVGFATSTRYSSVAL